MFQQLQQILTGETILLNKDSASTLLRYLHPSNAVIHPCKTLTLSREEQHCSPQTVLAGGKAGAAATAQDEDAMFQVKQLPRSGETTLSSLAALSVPGACVGVFSFDFQVSQRSGPLSSAWCIIWGRTRVQRHLCQVHVQSSAAEQGVVT